MYADMDTRFFFLSHFRFPVFDLSSVPHFPRFLEFPQRMFRFFVDIGHTSLSRDLDRIMILSGVQLTLFMCIINRISHQCKCIYFLLTKGAVCSTYTLGVIVPYCTCCGFVSVL